ncbi:MAG: hypothetical protein C0407_10140 [Desulfobacca sp.]|nr:hypothetical protein [Desulfobacca sp.]
MSGFSLIGCSATIWWPHQKLGRSAPGRSAMPIFWGDSRRESDRESLQKLDPVERPDRIGFRMEALWEARQNRADRLPNGSLMGSSAKPSGS